MTQNDYSIIVATLKTHYREGSNGSPRAYVKHTVRDIVQSLARAFAKDNPEFVASTFIDASTHWWQEGDEWPPVARSFVTWDADHMPSCNIQRDHVLRCNCGHADNLAQYGDHPLATAGD